MRVKKSHHYGLSPGGLNVIEAAMQVAQVPCPISQSLLQRHPQLTNFLEGKNLKLLYAFSHIDSQSLHIYLEQELEPNWRHGVETEWQEFKV